VPALPQAECTRVKLRLRLLVSPLLAIIRTTSSGVQRERGTEHERFVSQKCS
jgi:hypothetical protein